MVSHSVTAQWMCVGKGVGRGQAGGTKTTRTSCLQSPGGLEVGGSERTGNNRRRGINSGSRIWRLGKPGYIRASPGSPGDTPKPPNKDKTYTHAHTPALMARSLGQPASSSPQGWADPIGRMWGVQGPQDHLLPGTRLHTVTTSPFPDGDMLCAEQHVSGEESHGDQVLSPPL